MYFSLSIHKKGGFITMCTDVYKWSVKGNTINKTKNSFPRVHMKKICTDSQYSKRKGNCCKIEHYIKTFENSKILGLCNKCKNIQGVIIWPKSAL